MTDVSGPPFRADHVGSLLRPPELLEARAGRQAGRIAAADLRRVEDAAIREAVLMQAEIGLNSVTDGEFRRRSWHMDFLYRIGGVAETGQALRLPFRNENGTVEAALGGFRIAAKLTLDDTIFGEDFAYLKSVAPAGTTAKLTIPSPSMLHYRGGPAAIDPAVYSDMEAFWADLAMVYAEEIRGLDALGCTYLQLDDTSLAYLNDPAQRAFVSAIGGDGDRQHLTNIKVINAALAERPPGITITTHLCRGNFRSAWMAEGGYDYVAETLFGELDVDGFFSRIRRRALGRFRTVAVCPAWQEARCARARHDQACRSRIKGRTEAADRRGGEICAARPVVFEPAMRLFVDGRGQRADDRGTERKAPPRRRNRPRDLGLSEVRRGGGALATPQSADRSRARSTAAAVCRRVIEERSETEVGGFPNRFEPVPLGLPTSDLRQDRCRNCADKLAQTGASDANRRQQPGKPLFQLLGPAGPAGASTIAENQGPCPLEHPQHVTMRRPQVIVEELDAPKVPTADFACGQQDRLGQFAAAPYRGNRASEAMAPPAVAHRTLAPLVFARQQAFHTRQFCESGVVEEFGTVERHLRTPLFVPSIGLPTRWIEQQSFAVTPPPATHSKIALRLLA